MSILTDLRAALGKLVSAEERWESERTRKAALDEAEAWENMHDLLTCDTIAALVAVAEAAEREPRCPFCAEERHMAGWPTQPHLSDCPLAPLVKEAGHDRA